MFDSPLQSRGVSAAAAPLSSFITAMPLLSKPEGSLPLPSGARRSAAPRSTPPFLRRRWVIVALGVMTIMLYTLFSSGSSHSDGHGGAAHAGIRARETGAHTHNGFEREQNVLSEDDVLSENELAIDNEEEIRRTPEEAARYEAIQKQAVKDAKNVQQDQLRTLIWWLYSHGEFPESFKGVPSAEKLEEMGQEGLQKYLEDMDDGSLPFADTDGWWDHAGRAARVTVFSKVSVANCRGKSVADYCPSQTYCPYSKRAKAILEKYHIEPYPYIVELDQRDDGHHIQDMLKILTGRRTVPNVIVDFASLGGSDEITLLDAEGGLQRRLINYRITS